VLNGDGWTVFRSYLATGQMELLDIELRAIGVALRMSFATLEVLRAHRVATAPLFSDSQPAIRWTAHLDPEPGKNQPRAINEHSRAIHTHSIEVTIHWVPGH
jgi:hypothetical protein